MIDRPNYRLSRNAFGRLVFTGTDGEAHEGVIPVRAFPITAPDYGIALIGQHGHELIQQRASVGTAVGTAVARLLRP